MKNIVNVISKVDGGVVKKVLPPSSAAADRIAVVGVWSGGRWSPHDQFWIQQFRAGVPLGQWQVAGVTLISGHDAVFLLSLPGPRPFLAEGDILVFDQGSFTLLDVEATTLPIESDKAIEVGHQRYHGVALTKNGLVRKIIFFHRQQATIAPETVQCVWWQGRQYTVETAQRVVRVV